MRDDWKARLLPSWCIRLRRSVKIRLSFAALAISFAVVLAIFGYAITTARDISEKNRELAQQSRTLAIQAKQLAREGKQAHDSLCAVRADTGQRVTSLKKRIATSRKFLKEHPEGISGISAAVIRNGIKAQQVDLASAKRTKAALSTFLEC